MTTECRVCRSANPEDKKYCGDCGAPLYPASDALREVLATDIQRRIETTLREQFKDQKLVEVETSQAIATRLSDWAKLLAFFVGIPVALLILLLGVMGVKTYSDFTSKVDLAQERVSKDLEEAQNSASSLKRESAALAEEYKKLRTQLIEAGTLADEVKQLTIKVDRIEQKVGFSPSSKVTPATKRELEASFYQFQGYLQKLGFRPKHGQVEIDIRDVMPSDGILAYYEDKHRRMVINRRYADDADLLYREYMHHVLYPDGLPRDSGEKLWAYYAVESALATYFSCSYKGRPSYAEKAMEGKGWNLESSRSFKELHPDVGSAMMVGTEVWGSAFWEMRKLLGQSAADSLLFKTWFDFRPEEASDQGSIAFARKLLERIDRFEGGKYASKVRAIFAKRDLAV